MNETYLIQTPIKGVDERPGESVEMSAELAGPLLKCGAITRFAPPEGSVADSAGEAPAEMPVSPVHAAIQAMFDEDPEKQNPEFWLKNGKPEVKEIQRRSGLELSAAERDAAWADFITD